MSARIGSHRVLGAGLRLTAPVLALGSLLWLLLFWPEAVAAVRVWSGSTAYGHCFLVLPVAGWLAWERRGVLAARSPRPWPWAAAAALPLGIVWLAAERLGVMEARQLVAIAVLQVLMLATLGPALWWGFAVPLLYLIFLVPFGGFLVGPLQAFTARFIDIGLDLLGVAHVVTSTVIEIPEGVFRVAEACAGLRFLIAAIAFGVVYACVIYRSPGRRLVFLAVSAVVPVLANGMRALGIVVLGHVLGSAQAAAVDHLLYGWIFFSIVIILLILAGLPFRQDLVPAALSRSSRASPGPASPASGSPSPAAVSRMAMAAAAVLMLAGVGPAVAAMLDRRAEAEQALLPGAYAAGILGTLAPPPGCAMLRPGYFNCAGIGLIASVQAFGAHAAPASVVAARHDASGDYAAEDASNSTWTIQRGVPREWQVTRTSDPASLTATALWVGGQTDLSGLALRLRQARASLFGAAGPTILVAVSIEPAMAEAAAAEATLRRFLEAQMIKPSPWPATRPDLHP